MTTPGMAKTVEQVADELRAKHAPATDAERRLCLLAVTVYSEEIAAGRTATQAWDRVTNLTDQALVGQVCAHEGKHD